MKHQNDLNEQNMNLKDISSFLATTINHHLLQSEVSKSNRYNFVYFEAQSEGLAISETQKQGLGQHSAL